MGTTTATRDAGKTAPATEGNGRIAFISCTARTNTKAIERALRSRGFSSLTLESNALPGQRLAESIQNNIKASDLVIAVIGQGESGDNVMFELGYARALGKVAVLFIPPTYPLDFIVGCGIPYLRTEPTNEHAVDLIMDFLEEVPPETVSTAKRPNALTHPIREGADQLLAYLQAHRPSMLTDTADRSLQEIVREAVSRSGVRLLSDTSNKDFGVDLVAWSNDFEPLVGNPLLIQCKTSLDSATAVNAEVGRLYRILETTSRGWALAVYLEGNPKLWERSLGTLRATFVAAEDFLRGLKDKSLGAMVRDMRNVSMYGVS